MDIRHAPRRKLVRRSVLLATAVTGLALVGSSVHGVAAVDGKLARAAAEKNARQAQQVIEHRAAEQVIDPRAAEQEWPYWQPPPVRYREMRAPRPDPGCPWAHERRRL